MPVRASFERQTRTTAFPRIGAAEELAAAAGTVPAGAPVAGHAGGCSDAVASESFPLLGVKAGRVLGTVARRSGQALWAKWRLPSPDLIWTGKWSSGDVSRISSLLYSCAYAAQGCLSIWMIPLPLFRRHCGPCSCLRLRSDPSSCWTAAALSPPALTASWPWT